MTYASPDCVGDVTPATLITLSCISDDDLKLGMFVEDLLNAAVIASLLPRQMFTPLLGVVVFLIVAEIPWSGY